MDIIECQKFSAGRRIALVGNANSIFGKGHGLVIDSYDIVVRFNYGGIKSVRDQGKRTDVLAISDSRIEWDLKSAGSASHVSNGHDGQGGSSGYSDA